MNKIFLFILVFSLLCTPSLAANKTEQHDTNQQTYSTTVSEFEILLRESQAENSTQQLNKVKGIYSGAINSLTQYDDSTLMTMGYSEETIALVQKVRATDNYIPTVAELASAAPKMTFYCHDFIASTPNNTTKVTFNWTFKWSSRPLQQRVDAVGAVWNHNGMFCKSATHEVTFSDGTTYDSTSSIYGMDIIKNDGNKSVTMTFPMFDDDSSSLWCVSGRGSFSLYKNEKVTSVQVAWGYGHQTMASIEGINLTLWGASLNFGSSYTTLCQDIRTYYVN